MLAQVRLPFIENYGQVNQEVKFYATTFAGTVSVTEHGLTYAMTNGASPQDGAAQGVAVKETFLTGQALRPTGSDRSAAVVSYFVGDESRWRSGVPTYNTVAFAEVWPRVDVELRVYGDNVEKVFKVEPEGRVEDIRLAFEGVVRLAVGGSGQLLVETPIGTVAMTAPFAFQYVGGLRTPREVSYFVDDNTYGFVVGHYDPRYTLVIDPLLASTFIGGSASRELATSIALDVATGNVFMAGLTSSSNYPTTPGAYDTIFPGDVFVSKFNSDLTSLLASTFLGPTAAEAAPSIALDASGNVYVTHFTGSSLYPTTPGAYDTTQNGGSDVFVSKLNNGLTSLLASTFLGGFTADATRFVALDASGNVVVAGSTMSSNYPTTPGAFDTTGPSGGDVDAFVSKLNNGLTSLLASTFLGGSASFDRAKSIALDASGNVFVTGSTSSNNFPTTPGAYDRTLGGFSDVFVSKLDSGLTSLFASTFIGGSIEDEARSIALDASGNVFVTGSTNSNDYPTTPGAYDTTLGGLGDVFVSKFNSDLTSLFASTFIGGNSFVGLPGGPPGDLVFSQDDEARSIALDAAGDVFVAGWTTSSDYPTLPNPGAYDTTFNGGGADVFVTHIRSDLALIPADDEPPTITVPADFSVGTDPGVSTAVVTYAASATDNVGVVSFDCVPPSGSTFPLDSTTVTCTAADAAGNPATASFTVTVIDDEPPDTSITSAVDGHGASVSNGGSTASTSITFTFAGADNVEVASLECSLDGGAFSPCTSLKSFSALATGSHTFEVRAIDTAGNVDPTPAGFSWIILTPAEAVSELIDDINAMGLPQGVANSLTAPLKDALKKLTDSNPSNDMTACGKLQDFIDQVNAKENTGQITPAQAALLRQAAEAIRAALGC